ncbi:unnamed protein product, partial [Meganyctiphanes norvegica]
MAFNSSFLESLGTQIDEDTESSLRINRLPASWKNLLMGLVRNPKAAQAFLGLNRTGSGSFNPYSWDQPHNITLDLSPLMRRRDDPGRTVIILLAYSIIIAISLFGNLLVCHVVIRTRRLHTVTNTFLANLAFSDLLMTALNIPFNVARVLLDDWPFGGFMCSMVPCVQVMSVYVSAFTMVAIALDRYQVIVHPLKPRLGAVHGLVIIGVIWCLAALFSIPTAMYHQVAKIYTYKMLTRCQARFPEPALEFRKWLTLATFLSQYAIPLSITAVAYLAVTRKVWWRVIVGAATQEQLSLQTKAKKKTVKMLLVVVVMFAICWLPLNTYHLVTDFATAQGPRRHSSTVFFICHWFAMSNVCYNPFIYCWLNDHFRAGAKAWMWCVAKKVCRINLPDYDDKSLASRHSRNRDSSTLSSSSSGFTGTSFRRKGRGSLRSQQSIGTNSTQGSIISNVQVPANQNLLPHMEYNTGSTRHNRRLCPLSLSTSVNRDTDTIPSITPSGQGDLCSSGILYEESEPEDIVPLRYLTEHKCISSHTSSSNESVYQVEINKADTEEECDCTFPRLLPIPEESPRMLSPRTPLTETYGIINKPQGGNPNKLIESTSSLIKAVQKNISTTLVQKFTRKKIVNTNCINKNERHVMKSIGTSMENIDETSLYAKKEASDAYTCTPVFNNFVQLDKDNSIKRKRNTTRCNSSLSGTENIFKFNHLQTVNNKETQTSFYDKSVENKIVDNRICFTCHCRTLREKCDQIKDYSDSLTISKSTNTPYSSKMRTKSEGNPPDNIAKSLKLMKYVNHEKESVISNLNLETSPLTANDKTCKVLMYKTSKK